MEKLPPLNQPSKLIWPPTVKRERSGDSHGRKVKIIIKSFFSINVVDI